jgi:hypothetical protein
MSLQMSTMGVCHALLRFPDKRSPLAVLRFPTQSGPLAPYGLGSSQSMSQRMEPTSYLISKQAVPYRTRDGTCYPGVSTAKIQSLADSTTTNHIT